MNEKLLNKVISVAYSDAGIRDKIFIYWRSKKDPKIKTVLDEYRRTANAVHTITKENFQEKILSSTGYAKPEKGSSFFLDLYTVLFSNPIKTFAVTLIITVAAVSSVLLRKSESQKVYSRHEIEQADAQARRTLAMVGNIINKTKTSVIKEIIPEKVSKPINDGLNYVKYFFQEEKKNENIN